VREEKEELLLERVEAYKYMGLMQWGAAQQARELQSGLGLHVLHSGFKCH